MVGIFLVIFSHLVTIGLRLEMCIKSGRIIDSPPKAVKVENSRLEEPQEEDMGDVNHYEI